MTKKQCITCNKWHNINYYHVYDQQENKIEVYDSKTGKLEQGYQCAYCYVNDFANSDWEREEQLEHLNDL